MDARSSARFNGEVPEPRPSLPSGGMKGAMNLHYSSLLDADLGTFKTKAELAKGVVAFTTCANCIYCSLALYKPTGQYGSLSPNQNLPILM